MLNSQLIVALDYARREDALSLVHQLDPFQCALKVGSELFTLCGPDFVRELIRLQFKVFLDLKFHDIPNTVARACKVAADLGVWMINVHASGGFDMMHAARHALADYIHRPLLIAVTVLTSMTERDLVSIGVPGRLNEHVLFLSKMAQEAGLDGVVCSAHEVAQIKSHCSADFLAVTPGIRLPSNEPDDQSRIITPEEALQAGSDYLVVGRSITRAMNPQQVITDLLKLCTKN
jgi:orotidine-5'-phosphate decarboxylase